MNFITFFALLNLILALPAHVVVVTQVKTVTVINGPGGLSTILVDVPVATDAPAIPAATKPSTLTAGGNEQSQQTGTVATTLPTDVVIPTPSTTTTPATTTTSSTAPAATTSSSSGSGEFSGQGTYYDTGLGACGITNVDTDYIVAISHELFDETNTGNPNNNPVCGKKIKASFEGKTVDVTVTDRCEGCAYHDLDFSPSAFKDIADQALGRIDITWDWA